MTKEVPGPFGTLMIIDDSLPPAKMSLVFMPCTPENILRIDGYSEEEIGRICTRREDKVEIDYLEWSLIKKRKAAK